jgi:hypothetical protein
LPRRTSCHRAHDVEIAEQFFSRAQAFRLFFLDLAAGAQEQFRITDDALANQRLAAPGGVKHPYFLGRELMVGNLPGKTLAVVRLGARHRDQVLHRRVRADFSQAHVLLHRVRQVAHQRQPARDPGHAPVETPGEVLQVQAKAAMQLRKQPPLFKCRFSFRSAQGSVQDECFGFVHIPNRGAHRIVPETLQRPDSLETIDYQKSVRFPGQADHNNGDLLAVFGKG